MRALLAAVCLAILACLPCQAQEAGRNPRDTARFVIEGAVRGMTIPAVVAGQHERALGNWKRLFTAEVPENHESQHFLLYGALPGKKLKEVDAHLEKIYALAVKTLDMEGDEPWPGKMAIYFASDQRHYNGLVRVVEKRKAEDGESSTFEFGDEETHAILGPSESKLELVGANGAGAQIAAALFAKKTMGTRVPSWMAHGFGRATVYRAAPYLESTAERRRAAGFVTAKKRNLRHVLGGGLNSDEAAVLRASLMDYLLYSGKTARFPDIVKALRPTEEMQEPTFESALTAANLSLDRLDQTWQAWLKSFK